MAYCSVEEAWGAPLTHSPTMFENSTCSSEFESPEIPDNPEIPKNHETSSEVSTPTEQFDGSITDPPLRGSLLGGAIPDPLSRNINKHSQNTPLRKKNETKYVEFKSNDGVTQRLDQLIDILGKKNCTSWYSTRQI